MRNSRCLARATRLVPWLAAASLAMSGTAFADGLLGVFFDDQAQTCSGDVPTLATLYLCFQPSGSTSGGITGVEFRIESSDAHYTFMGTTIIVDSAVVGSPLNATMGFSSGCQSGGTIAILRFTVQNYGGTQNAEIHVVAKDPPSNRFFPCPLVTLCDEPSFTTVCIEGGKTILNPSAPRPCGSSRVQAEWSKVKALYR